VLGNLGAARGWHSVESECQPRGSRHAQTEEPTIDQRAHRAARPRRKDRLRPILEAVVTEYVGTAQPVGSGTWPRWPASTSRPPPCAPRVARPRARGLPGAAPYERRADPDRQGLPVLRRPPDRARGARAGPAPEGEPLFDQVHGEMEQMLERTSGLCRTSLPTPPVVVGAHPRIGGHRDRSNSSARPTPWPCWLWSWPTGRVEKRSIELGDDTPDELLAAASTQLQLGLQGPLLAETGVVAKTGDAAVDRARRCGPRRAQRSVEPRRSRARLPLVVPSRLAVAFDAVETVPLGARDPRAANGRGQPAARDVLDRGLSVVDRSGEHGYEPLASWPLVVAPVSSTATYAGAVGLLGPTRMNYPQALAAAHVVGERLGERIG